MEPVPSPAPRPDPSAAGAERGPAENPFAPAPGRGSRTAVLAAAAIAAILASSAVLVSRRAPQAPPVPPAVTAANAAQEGETLVAAVPAGINVEAARDACWKPGPSLDAKLPEARWSRLPESWRKPLSGGSDGSAEPKRAFPEGAAAREGDLPPPGSCRLPGAPSAPR
ncbi:MAG: hypothetical protein HY553_01475 [Elusimicrobia bacterium]|nr:hypothetical protein [Elusimicrobiota bacterium]